ncbi:MAG TPA: alkaline phosphatase family protein [Streptosporangiaceae bacterium]|nr:alkaline phosphatase family protein [Streptosporangiaceae bacterium]
MSPMSLSLTGIELIAKALTPTYPGDFAADVASGSLPSVSWIMSPLAVCEHPAAPPEYGEHLVQQVLNALAGTLDVGIPYPPPTRNHMPVQAASPARPPVPS